MLPSSFTPALLKKLELLNLKNRRTFLGSRQGGHLSLKRGHGLEFSDYRKYELGDHPRYIDWGVYARSQRLYVKRFQEEQDISVLIILDASGSMRGGEGSQKWMRAKELCLALSYIALGQQDSVTVAGLGSFTSPTYYGLKSLHHLSGVLDKSDPVGDVNLQREVSLAASRIRFPGIAIFISDFLMPFDVVRKMFTYLRSKNLDISALQLLDESDLDPFRAGNSFIAVDSESNEEFSIQYQPELKTSYDKHMQEHQALLRKYFKDNNIASAVLNSSDKISNLMTEKLSNIGLLA